MAASTIAGDEVEFLKWLDGTGAIEIEEAPADQAFCDELAQAKLLPTWFPNINTAEFDSRGLHSLPIIQLAWGTLKLLEKQRTSYDPKEADWCLAIDLLIQHVFGRMDFENNTAVFRESQLYLVHSPKKIIETAVADVIVVLKLRGHIRRLPRQFRVECACLPHANLRTLHILHFISEMKGFSSPASALNQMIYGLTTALFQRRGLGIQNQLVFGCCTQFDEVLVYSGSWEESQVAQPLSS
ncbi:hypothetical protein BS47DRAFT_1157201 [Hydnum rufescens UP504]|uniref:Uncharacterized protein n=1 Tax=Hydnum rufescens UP504 TaxID=1448309 RepID=A0A9P6B8P5_9AGAM|nr:hypothetical protein BS47DRAFT_1157201 [Hydnum rufescens UP504]